MVADPLTSLARVVCACHNDGIKEQADKAVGER